MKFEGAAAIVFGSARGIGRAYCESLLKRKMKVCCSDVLVDLATQTVKELGEAYGSDNVFFQKCDATKEEEIRNCLLNTKTKFGRLDLVVNSVGAIDESNWAFTIDINLGVAIRITTEALEIMGKDKGGPGGVIVHTASNAAILPGFYGPAYSAGKAGVVSYVRALSHKLNYDVHGVRMLAICPTITNTQLLPDSAKAQGKMINIEMLNKLVDFSKTDIMIEPEEVAEAMAGAVEDDSLTGVAVQLIHKTPTILFKDENTRVALQDKVQASTQHAAS